MSDDPGLVPRGPSEHLSPDELSDLVDGRPLGSDRIAHASDCRICDTQLREWRILRQRLLSLSSVEEPARSPALERAVEEGKAAYESGGEKRFKRERRRILLRLIAVLTVAAGVVVALLLLQDPKEEAVVPLPDAPQFLPYLGDFDSVAGVDAALLAARVSITDSVEGPADPSAPSPSTTTEQAITYRGPPTSVVSTCANDAERIRAAKGKNAVVLARAALKWTGQDALLYVFRIERRGQSPDNFEAVVLNQQTCALLERFKPSEG